MGRVDGKIAIITGAASGLGKATAVLLADEGAKVMLADLNYEACISVKDAIEERGGTAACAQVDVTRPEQVESLIETTLTTFGGLDVLCNNAGIEGGFADTADFCLESWHRAVDVNLNAVFYGLKYAIPAMLECGGGSIINTASILGLAAMPQTCAYAATKGAVIQLTRAAALDYATRGIRINALCPGTITSSMYDRMLSADPALEESLLELVPMSRLGTPEEVAQFMLFLASDDSSFCTGTAYVMDGGRLAQG